MPHVVVRMYPGRTDEQKRALARRIEEALVEVLGCGKETVSVGIEEVEPERWMDEVYRPFIEGREHTLWVRPGYGPLSEKA